MRNPLHIGRPRQPGDRGGMRDYGQYTSLSGIALPAVYSPHDSMAE